MRRLVQELVSPAVSRQDSIIKGMARALFVSAWADSEEEKDRGIGGGADWMDHAPPTPKDAVDAAEALAKKFEHANGGNSLDTLLAQAIDADGGEISGSRRLSYAEEFGHYLAMEALGHGVGWFDRHEKFPLKFPHIEYYVDSEEYPAESKGHGGRKLAALQERRYGRDTPEKEFLIAAGDAGAHVAHDKDMDSYVLTFDDKAQADDFKKEHLPDSTKVWRDQSGEEDRFTITVDRETATQSFTPDPDDYKVEMSEAMRVKDLGGDFSVTVPAADVEAFKDQWPGSELPDRAITFTFQKSNGDLVDIHPDGVDGADASALADDAKAFGKKKLGLGAAAVKEARRDSKPFGEPSACHHIIRHAVSDAERKAAKKALDYARSVDDQQGTMIALAQLQGCPSKGGKAIGEANPDSETPIGSGKNGYIAFYKNKRYEVYGDTILGAKNTLAQDLRVPPKKQHEINITLAELDGVPVVHTPTEGRMVNLRDANEKLASIHRTMVERAEAPTKGTPDLRWDDSEIWENRVAELMENPLDNDYFFSRDYDLGKIRDDSKSDKEFLEKVEAAGLTDKLKKMAEKSAGEDSDIYKFEWDDLTGEITTWMKKFSTDWWHAEVSGFGWRGTSGDKTFRLSRGNGEELLQKILPKTENRFDVYLGNDEMKIENWHHDKPTGGEWYTIRPATEEEIEAS